MGIFTLKLAVTFLEVKCGVVVQLKAVILTKAYRAAVSMIAKGCIVAKRCGLLSTASEVFLIFPTQLYQYLFALFCDKPEIFLPKYSQRVILHAPSGG